MSSCRNAIDVTGASDGSQPQVAKLHAQRMHVVLAGLMDWPGFHDFRRAGFSQAGTHVHRSSDGHDAHAEIAMRRRRLNVPTRSATVPRLVPDS
jgi:hypothetical protein